MVTAGDRVTDGQGRRLIVSRVDPSDRLGREVQGAIMLPGEGASRPYSTSLEIFEHVFVKRDPGPLRPSARPFV